MPKDVVAKKADQVFSSRDKVVYGPGDRKSRENPVTRRMEKDQGLSQEAYFKLFSCEEAEQREIVKNYAEKYTHAKTEFNRSSGEIKKYTKEELNEMDKALERIGNQLLNFREEDISIHSQIQISNWKSELDAMQPDILALKGYRSGDGRTKKVWESLEGENTWQREHVRNMFQVVSVGIKAYEKYMKNMAKGKHPEKNTKTS